MGHTFPSYEHVEHVVLFDVLNRLPMRHHREVVAVHLENFVVFLQAAVLRRRIFVHLRHIDTLIEERKMKLIIWNFPI